VNSLAVVARKELLDLRRNWFLGLLLLFILAAVTLSVVVGAQGFRVKSDEYLAYVEALRESGNNTIPAPPQLFPLRLVRGGIEYLELIGALFAIVVGYGMIAREKHRRTVELLLTRPISQYALGGGKLVAIATMWLIAVGVVFAAVIAVLLVVGNAPLGVVDAARLLICAGAAWVYLVMWSAIAMGLASVTRFLSTGLIAALVLWLVVVLIIPQIGDTLDPDNQVPGGLFKSLEVSRADEQAVLADFAEFDTVRNGLELSSITKHYERLSFAFLGIKDEHNGLPIADVAGMTIINSLSLAVAAVLAGSFAVLTTTRRTLLRRQE
jgi:ABC-2 type transport system permease protein